MPLVPQQRSPNVVPPKNQWSGAQSIEALAARLAALEAKQYPGTPQVIPPFSLLNPSSQAGLTIVEVAQGGSGGGGGGGGGSSGADSSLTYVTEANESAGLPNSRQLAAGTNITLVDNGAGGTLVINSGTGGFSWDVTNTSVTPYTVVAADVFIGANSTAGADQVINLPASTGSGRVILVKKMDANAHNIVVTAAGADKIDGLATYTITVQYAAIAIIDDAAAVWAVWNVKP